MNYLYYLREFFFPNGCGGCGTALLNPDDTYYGLCGKCRNFLKSALNEDRNCKICGKPLITEKDLCLSCRKKTNDANSVYNDWISKIKVFFPYRGKFQKILGAYKFKKSLGVGNFLASCLCTGLKDLCPELLNLYTQKTAAWVPVPPKPGKIKKQGWDQIEFLAGLLEKEYKNPPKEGQLLPVMRCLKRLTSRSQKELNREERGLNLKGRILCVKKPPKIAFLFDDVITTGATLNACAKALLEGGTEVVYGVCLFYD